MLSYMREHSKSWITNFIFGIIIIVFVLWGGSSYTAREASAVAKINKHIISQQQFSKTYSETIAAYQERYGQAFNAEMLNKLNLKERVLDEMISNYLMEQEAARLGIMVTDEELQDYIAKAKIFQRAGEFDMQRYRDFLEYERMTPKDFEELHRNDILRKRLFTVVTENVIVPDFELDASYRAVSDLFDLYYLEIDPAGFETRVEISADELVLYYEDHKDDYKESPKTVIEYISYDFDEYAKGISVSAEDAREYYDSHLDLYSTPETSRARHILIAIPEGATDDEIAAARTKAEKVLTEARQGADFAVLAREYSDDKGSAVRGGDLGEVKRGSLVDGLDDKLFAMQKGDIGGPFLTRYGFHVVRVDSVTKSQTRPFEGVSKEIIARIRDIRAKDLAYDAANNAFMVIYEQMDMDLKGFAASRKIEVKRLGPFSEDETLDLPHGKKLVREAFSVAEGDLGNVLELPDSFVIFKVAERRPSRIPELTEVSAAVKAKLTAEKAVGLARTEAERLAGLGRVELEKMSPQTTGEFKRSSWVVPRLGTISELKENLDNLRTPKAFVQGRKVYVVWLKSMVDADPALMTADQRNTLRDSLLEKKREMVFNDYLVKTRENYKIKIYHDRLI